MSRDIKTLFMAFFTSCIYIVSTPVMATGEDSTHEYCNMKAECITVTINYTAPKADDGDIRKWAIDDIKLMIDADQCRILVGGYGATKVIDGYVEYSVSNGVTDFSRTWKVPKGCPYSAHSRYNNSWKDEIRNDRISAVKAEKDYCIKIDFYTEETTSC